MTIAEVTAPLTGTYEIDAANSRIAFSARYAMITTVHGTFDRFRAQVELDERTPSRSAISLHIEAASLQTGQVQRDEHLRSPDFLDVQTYPELTFQATGVQKLAAGTYRLSGALSVCAVTRPVEVDFLLTGSSVDHRGYHLVGFTGTSTIRRSDFGLTWNAILETGGVLVGDEVELSFEITLIRVPGETASRRRTLRRLLR